MSADCRDLPADLAIAALTALPWGIAIVGPEGVIRCATPAMAALLGLPPEGLATGQTLADLTVRLSGRLVDSQPWAALMTGAPAVTLQLREPPGRVLRMLRRPLADHLLLVAVDETGTAERERAVRAFISSVSHDLRLPITVIQGYAQTLERRLAGHPDISERDRREIHQIWESARRLNRMITEIVDNIRLLLGYIEVTPQEVALTDLLERVVARVQADVTTVRIVQESSPPAPVLVRADPLRLEQVLKTVLETAARRTPAGGTVRVRTVQQAEQIVLEIEDAGEPLSASELADLLSRTEPRPGPEGLSLALSNARRLAERQGGTLTAEPLPTGIRWRLTLPLARQPASTPTGGPAAG